MPHIDLRARPKKGMKLHCELIPKTAWYKNVRTMMKKEHWDILRKHVYRRAAYVCQVCGGVGDKWPVECHEIWDWSHAGVQRLVGLIALCPDCHAVKHWGRTQNSVGRKERARLMKHQRRINKWSKAQQQAHIDAVWRRYTRRSKRKWKVNIEYAKRLLIKITGGNL
jgi:5-methylcytosine-specific restriction endonuclease McrA